ncbi:MAG: glycerophosphodiester phosphodiesterase [Bacteroidetes bacterium]|nr:glycerophosphodiester phosphodiesterase [Bacteroidota bacterium]
MLKNKDIKIIGHRGAAGIIAENSIESILTAINLGVDCIEIDVWKTTDNEIIVFHDAYLDRLTSMVGFVNQMDYSTIKKAKLKNNEHIPTLKEVIKIVKEKRIQLLIEVKSEDALELSVKILLEELPMSEFIVGSFFHKDIKILKEQNSKIQTSIMFESVPILLEEYLNIVNPDFVTISIDTYNKYLLETIKKQNRKLVFYTVNSEPEIELALNASPYAIVTDFPNLFIK